MRSLPVNDMVRSLVAPDERVVGVHVELLEPRPQTLSPMGRVRFAIGGKVWLGPDHPLKLLIIRVEILQVKQPVVSTTVEMVGCDPAVHRTPSPLCRPKVVHPYSGVVSGICLKHRTRSILLDQNLQVQGVMPRPHVSVAVAAVQGSSQF